MTFSRTPGTDGSGGNSEADGLLPRLARIGIALSAEKNLDALLERIVEEALDFTHADGVTLYLAGADALSFKISRNLSLGIRAGGTEGGPSAFPPVPMDPRYVSAYAALNKRTVNVADVYHDSGFDFTGPRAFDGRTGYRTVSMLATPLLDHEGAVIGVLQLINALDPATRAVTAFTPLHVELAESLASQAAVAITNVRLVKETERLFDGFLAVMATALDARSKYTHGHVRRVAGLAMEIARAVSEESSGPYANVSFGPDDYDELRVAGLMHDIGKIITPEHVLDKSVKLETIFDRAELIRTRYELIAAREEAGYQGRRAALAEAGAPPEKLDNLARAHEQALAEIAAERDFTLACNTPGEFLSDEKIERLRQVAARQFELGGVPLPRLNADELENLSIRKGSLNEKERAIIQNHIVITIRMLEQIPFTRKLARAPLYAGSHHECLDGSGYPNRLTADQMPLQSRILCVADFFEALTAADRPYKKAMPPERALAILDEEVKKGKLDGGLVALMRERGVFGKFEENFKAGAYGF